MRVLITGAGGNLGRCAAPALKRAGHDVRLFDFRPVDGVAVMVGDVRDRDAVTQALDGVDAVVHAAALHGIHLGHWSHDDFWATNVDGTFVVYDTACRLGVRRFVLASSMAVYGVGAGARDSWPHISEETPLAPADVYGLTKVVSEDAARFFAKTEGLSTVALRLGMFVPESFERYGFRLLFGGVDDRDVGQAVVAAVEHQPAGGFTAVNIMSDNGIRSSDLDEFRKDPAAAIEARWPGSLDLVSRHHLYFDDLVWGGALYPVDRARRELGYAPQHDFAAFLEAWRREDFGYYPRSQDPWWGAQRPHA